MITAIFLKPGGEWSAKVQQLVERQARVMDPDLDPAMGTPRADLAFCEAQHVTDELLTALQRTREMHPGCQVVCIAPEDVAEHAMAQGSISADYWLIVPAGQIQLQSQVVSLLDAARSRTAEAAAGAVNLAAPRLEGILDMAGGRQALPESALSRAVSRMTGSFDIERVFTAYCDAVHELTRCVSYCLLWEQSDAGAGAAFHVVRSEGLPPSVQETCKLSRQSPLPRLLQERRGIITADVLARQPESAVVVRELQMCGGLLAIPMFSEGRLRGMMVLGPKAISEPYGAGEVETLFMLSASVASAARQSELHQQLEARNKYIDQVLSTMGSGVVTLELDGRIRVCNPHASEVLGLDTETVIGSDIRVLPSPLGDYLYASLRYEEERTREEVCLTRGTKTLRVSTRRLLDQEGALMGSMMLVEDISSEKALAREKRKAERNEVISQIVARFAHELKNPLATIQTFTELLPERYDDEEFRQYCAEHVKRDVHRLDDLVVKLVSLSETPRLARQLVNVPELLTLAVDRVGLLDDTASERINIVPNGALPPVQVDADTMAAALAHLLRHGIGEKRNIVRVETAIQDGPAGEQPLAIFIRAAGDEADDTDPDLILEPSYVIDNPTVDLGPSASQRLIESQGGALEAYREDGDIVFRVSLIPVTDERADADMDAAAGKRAPR